MFVSRKLDQDLQVREAKPAIVSQQCVVYQFKCNLCDAGYAGYTRGYLHDFYFTYLHTAPYLGLLTNFASCVFVAGLVWKIFKC